MWRNKLVTWLLLVLVVMLSINVARSWVKISQRAEIISLTQDRLQQAKDQNESLKRKLAEVESQEYIEREARNKLNKGREGEIVLILPSVSPIAEPSPTPIDTSANWQKWVRLFL
ncbi:septum formation initiator family protein [Candidatus Gottesmanbacteria bacterium]|nr:septum formation initiator family protein [Candidatus Gottesmanbacteria bacterium]